MYLRNQRGRRTLGWPHVGINLYDDSNTIEITYRVEGDPEFRSYFVTLRDWEIAEVCMAE